MDTDRRAELHATSDGATRCTRKVEDPSLAPGRWTSGPGRRMWPREGPRFKDPAGPWSWNLYRCSPLKHGRSKNSEPHPQQVGDQKDPQQSQYSKYAHGTKQKTKRLENPAESNRNQHARTGVKHGMQTYHMLFMNQVLGGMTATKSATSVDKTRPKQRGQSNLSILAFESAGQILDENMHTKFVKL